MKDARPHCTRPCCTDPPADDDRNFRIIVLTGFSTAEQAAIINGQTPVWEGPPTALPGDE